MCLIMFDFDYFKKMLLVAYKEADIKSFTYEEVEWIFSYYITKYKLIFERDHKNLKLQTIINIIRMLPYLDTHHSGIADIDVEQYKVIIDKHFQVQYENCDYSISHFMSGNIRTNRFYETCY